MFKLDVYEKRTEESTSITYFAVKFTASYVYSIDHAISIVEMLGEIEGIRDRNGDLIKLSCTEDPKTGSVSCSLNSNDYKAEITTVDSPHT